MLFESRPWYGKQKIGGVLSIQVDLQITSRVRLVALYCINFTKSTLHIHVLNTSFDFVNRWNAQLTVHLVGLASRHAH